MTVESFKIWKTRFDKAMGQKKLAEEEEKLKVLTPKEREEYKRFATRLTGEYVYLRDWHVNESLVLGRQLFEHNKHLEDESLMEEGTVSVDVSQYDRARLEEQEENEGVTFSDSD